MIELRPFAKLGSADHGWLKAKHHFSFGGHYDPGNMGHGSLRVWNDDEIAPNTGFPAHPHANMEIITYVREGAITHQDSLGNKGRTEAGDVQVMSAGSGIRHSEYNLEPGKTKIFQIWIEPTTQGGQPTWGAKPFPKSDRSGKLVTIASGIKGDADALPIRADARVLATTLKAGESAAYTPAKQRRSQRCARQCPRRRRDPRRGRAQDHRAGGFRAGAGRRGVNRAHQAGRTRHCHARARPAHPSDPQKAVSR
jgi:quercetin 2,3-dioxygenase